MANSDISGQITDGSGNAIANAEVYLWREDLAGAGGVVVSTTADSSGNFAFTAHPDGTSNSESWHVAAEDPNANVQLQSAYGITASPPTSVNSQFDVSITGTPASPVLPGGTLTVDVSLTNSGTDSDTQTITLDIDNGVGQVDSSLEAAQAGASDTTTLEWAVPSNQTQQDYQATVSSEDDSASQTVTPGLPDSTILFVDAKDITDSFSDGDTVNTWSDLTDNGNDLAAVGAPTFRDSTNDINGNPTVVYDGNDDGHAGPSIAGDVLTVIMVVEPQIDPLGNVETWHSVDDSNFDGQAWTNNGNWEVKGSGEHLGNSDTSPQVHTVVWDAAGSDGLFRQNGVQQSSGDISESVNTFAIGFRASGNNSFGNHAVSLAEVHDTILSTSEIEIREQVAADRYDIAL